MAQPTPIRRDDPAHNLLRTGLELAKTGVPVLPLRQGKVPFGNCRTCTGRPPACGGRPNMKAPGTCQCPAVCHAWAAATTDPIVITSPAWAPAWRQAVAVAYHPGGAGLTVVDLDNAAAVAWARQTLPVTRTVPTTRGEHWIYRGTMPSANQVRPGVDIKSRMAYARWLGPGNGTMTNLPSTVRALLGKEETTPARGAVVSSSPARAEWDRTVATGCRHTERYIRTGLQRGLDMVRSHTESGAGSQAFGVARFLTAQHTECPGPCGLDVIAGQIIAAAVSVGVPEAYAERAVTNGLNGLGAAT
ncbi:DNA primase [Streptomyces yatensis]|uniref:Bifunctional DNA primase/polymerase n=1 Tax=Streptomyces yatensis TaxID=155177 RepID=A0ABN2IRK7_9ACTN|nr:DNA primase [Streptomyces yatensis]